MVGQDLERVGDAEGRVGEVVAAEEEEEEGDGGGAGGGDVVRGVERGGEGHEGHKEQHEKGGGEPEGPAAEAFGGEGAARGAEAVPEL